MATTTLSDHYKVLGVTPDADAAAIKTAYRKLVLKCHPDKVSDPALKEQKQDEFQQVQQSYETLSDPDKRQRYDLELRARELREERDRTRSRTTSAAPRTTNVRVSTNPDFRTPHSPPKMPTHKSFSGATEYKTRDPHASYRSKHSYEEIRTSRSASDEKLRRDDYRDSRESRESRRREEDSEYRRAKKEREEYERKYGKLQREREREREREQEREYREAQAKAAKVERKAREREREQQQREKERRKLAEEAEKSRSKPRSPYVEPYYNAEELDDRKSRKTKSPKKDSTASRDKSSSKLRDRSSAREEVPLPSPPPELPAQSDVMKSKLDFAASYISSKTRLPKHAPEVPVYSDPYPDPNKTWTAPQRRSSGEARHVQTDPIEIVEGGSPPRAEFDAPSAQASPPRLQKTYTAPPGQMFPSTEAPSHTPKRATLNRAQTMGPEYMARPDRYKPSRGGRSSMDDSHDDYFLDPYAPKVQKYTVRRGDNHIPRTESYYGDSTSSPSSVPFSKVKTSQHIRPENVERTRSYGMKDAATMNYQPMFSNPAVYTEA